MLVINNVSSNIIRIDTFQKYLFSFILISLFSLSANGQNYDLEEFGFEVNGVSLLNPGTGGFTAPQLSEIDINMDGQMDLLVFDRRGDLARAFFHDGVAGSLNYKHDPYYQASLPPLRRFLRVNDYNGDGVPDIFTGPADTSGGIAVYTGTWDGDKIRFSLYRVGNYPFNVLTVTANNAPVNLYSSILDVPAILDLDGDGDTDVLSFEPGGSYVSFYKNMVIEKNLGLDTFDFILQDFCWGKFKEGGFDGTITLSDNVSNCAQEFAPPQDATERHAGSTIEAFDYQCDGDYDLLIGDLVSTAAVLIINEPSGGIDFAVGSVSEFPENDPIEVYVFPSMWVLDIDHDGDEDIVACPNEDSNALNVSNFHLYENNNGSCNDDYELKQRDFLNETGVDLGTDSSPAFLDYNQDGLIDLLVGTTGEFDATGQPQKLALVLFENVGDIDRPSYELVDDDYLGFSINTLNRTNPAVSVGDITGDGFEDIIVGDSEGKLFFYENTTSGGGSYTFAQAVFPYMDLDVGQNVEPYIYDYNGDGLGDLFIGEKGSNTNNGLGSINYVQNKGTVGNAFFDDSNNLEALPNSLTFNKVYTKIATESSTNAAPAIFKVGNLLLGLFGTEQGCLQLWELVEGDVDAEATLLDDCLGGIYEGDQTSIDLEDIDNDGFLEVVVGNKRGGIAFYNTTIHISGTVGGVTSTSDIAFDIELFPNPALDKINIESELNLSNYKLVNIFGQLIEQGVLADNLIKLNHLSSGVYFISFEVRGQQVVKKFIKE